MRLSGNILFSIVFAAIAGNFAIAQTIDSREQSVIELQNTAKQVSRQWTGEAIRRSIALYLDAAKEWKNLDHPEKAASCLRESAQLYLLLGENDSALLRLSEALKLTSSGNSLSEKAKTQSLLSIVYLRTGKKAESKYYFESSLRESELSKDAGAQASANFSAAEYHYTQNEFAKAIDYYQKSFDRWQEAGNLHGQAEVLIYYAYVHMVLGEPAEGLAKAKEAERIFKETGETRGIKLSQIAIGHLLSVTDNKQAALEYYLEAGKDFPDDLDSIEKAALFNGIGMVYEDYRDFEMSLNYREKAFALFEKEKYFYGQLSTMHSLIKLNYLLQNPQKAEYYFEETKRLSALLNDNYFLAIAYRQIGDYYFEQGEASDTVALDYYQKSLKTSQLTGYKENDALVLDKLGMIYERQNQFQKASAHYNSALEISRKISNRFIESQILFNLARLSRAENKDEIALEQIKRSIEITEQLTANVLNSKLKSAYFSNAVDRYSLFIGLLMKRSKESSDQNYAIEALRAAEKSRARVMLENLSLSEANFTKDADAGTVRREKEIRVLLNVKADKLTDLLSSSAEKSETDRLSNEIGELENELENIKARLKQQSPVYSAIKNPAPFDVADFQRQVLDENSLLLEFSFGADESYLWLVGKNEFGHYILPPRAELETHIETLRALLKERELKSGESVEDFQKRILAAETRYQTEAEELSRKLLGQIAAKLSGKRLIIVPDGKLHYFPVAALPFPDSAANEPILLTNETIYEPSAQTLTMLAKSRRQTAAAKDLLVFSDPIFTLDDARFSTETSSAENTDVETARTESFRFIETLSNLPRLSASGDESETIIGIVGASAAENYSGFTATRENLLNLKTSDYKILHFATHGLTNEKRPELSGIALSGFDEKRQKLNQLFRIQDIYALNLNADLVVLSACDTGVGKEIKGEGLMSLNNAFLQTGAKSVVASLWKVEDGATLELMKHFYGAMVYENLTPSQSLRRAQMKLRENPQYKSPFYWAAFTVQGDFRSVPKISRGYGFWIYLLPVLPLALIGFYLYRRKMRKPAGN